METIRVTLEGKAAREVPRGTIVADLVHEAVPPAGLRWIAAMVNNDLVSLLAPLEVESLVQPLTMTEAEGAAVYERSLCFLLAKAVKDLCPAAELSVNYAMGDSVYCTLDAHDAGATPALPPGLLDRIEARMRDLVARDVPIERRKVGFAEAVRRFQDAGQADELRLLRFRNAPRLVLHGLDGFYDLTLQPLAPTTGCLPAFALHPYPPGFLLRLPPKGNGLQLAPFQDHPKLFQVFQERELWGRILGVDTVGRLNEIVADGGIADFVKIAEALHEKKIGRIADEVAERHERARVVLIAGPSSSGKTTFAKRLAIQLRVSGMRPVTISLDDYFFEHARTPRDAQGQFDFEHIEALDLALFNSHLGDLLAGREIELPHFNFESHQREFLGRRLRVANDQPMIIEGIHALNPRLTAGVPDGCKYRLYVSALTQLSLDSHNRISTTDNRLIRRLVRDARYRGHAARDTLRQWPSVRRGEDRWVFPFQEQADVMFNSALDYELAVLKPIVEPLLLQVKPDEPEYAASRRLTALLFSFLPLGDRGVPPTSILREAIGKSSFSY